MNKIAYFLLVIGLLYSSCKQEKPQSKDPDFSLNDGSDEEIEATKIGGVDNKDLIRMPVTADGVKDTINVARIVFDKGLFNFGEVIEGELVKHEFTFTNTGKIPLVISDARATCGCTVPDYPKKPIPPNGKGVISVVFDTKGKGDFQRKPVNILSNAYPNQTEVILEGRVVPKPTKK
jgi:hypothetical protein